MKKTYAKIIMSMIFGVMVFSRTYGSTFHWEGAISNDWNNPNNWLELSLPTSSDDVVFNAGSYDCLLNCPTSINSLYIQADYGYQLTIPTGCNLYLSGNLKIEVADNWNIWAEKPNITLCGSNSQTIEIVNYTEWTLETLTINKPAGDVTLNSNITVRPNGFFNETSTPIIDNSYIIIGACTPPVTGGIYHIANDFAI